MPNWTKAEYEEVIKCRRSFKYFAEKYLQITHPKRGLLPFVLYPFQERVINEFETNTYCIVKKFRQAGLTTVSCMWLLWKCLFFNDQRVMIVSKTDREARGVGKTVANAKEKLPAFLQPLMGNDNDHEKEFKDTGSVMWFFTPSAARSRSLTYLVVDEAAFIQGMDDHWAAIYPTLATGGNCVVISTVNGIGNWYEQTYTNAKDRKNQFHIVEIDWHEHPDYNNAEWEKRTRANLGPKRFAQEIEGSFLGSGETYISAEMILEYERLVLDPIHKGLPEWDTIPEETFDEAALPSKIYEPGALWIWEKAKPGREYILAADVAEGVGDEGDYSAFVVLDMHNLTQVAEFYSNTIPTYKYAQVIKQVADLYNQALVVVENSMGPGNAVCERLQHSLAYENLYFSQTGQSNRDKPGLTMSKVVRPLCMESLQTCVLNRIVKIRSVRIIRELKTFIYNKTKQRAEATKGKHDDLVIALSAALHVADAISREMPIMGNSQMQLEMDLVTKALLNDDYDKLREELEMGILDDMLETDEVDVDLLPKVLFKIPKRPHDAILKEFGW